MVTGKINPTATIVAQYPANCEVDAIQHDGKIYLPVMNLGEFTPTSGGGKDAPAEKPAPAKKPVPTPAPAKEAAPAKAEKAYTEEELMDMEVKELLRICKDLGIDPNATEGKNTNKKLRNLILDVQEGVAGEAAPAKEDDDLPFSESDPLYTKEVAELLEEFDSGSLNEKKVIEKIEALAGENEYDEKAVKDAFRKFVDDDTTDLMEIAREIAAALAPVEKKSAAKKSSRRTSTKEEEPASKEPKGKLVEPDELEVGDRVAVWWDDDNQAWFTGEVANIRRGKVTIAYDDETEGPIEDIHTKIKLLEE